MASRSFFLESLVQFETIDSICRNVTGFLARVKPICSDYFFIRDAE